MKKLLLLSLLLLIFPLTVQAQEIKRTAPLMNVNAVINEMSQSVFLLERFKKADGQLGELLPPMAVGKGCAVAAYEKNGMVYFLTAYHVVEDVAHLELIVGEKRYKVTEWKRISKTDAAFFSISKTNLAVKVLPLNLNPSGETIPAIALGMWHRTTKVTGTFGYVNRSVIDAWTDKIYNYQLMKGFIAGTSLIARGYSGGALVDEQGRLLGINVVLGSTYCYYVDIRYIWNQMIQTHQSETVKIPWTSEHDVLGSEGFKRVAANSLDSLVLGEKTTTFKEIMDAFDAVPSAQGISPWVNKDTIIDIHGVKYKISRVEFESDISNYGTSVPNYPANKYVYFANDGWQLYIFLAEIS